VSEEQLAGFVLIIGSIVFWLGAFTPVTRAFITEDPDERIRIISGREHFWIIAHLVFLIGAVMTTIGLGIFTFNVAEGLGQLLAVIGFVLAVAGTIVFTHIIFAFRLLMLAEEYVHTQAGAWTFPAYTLLWLGGVILCGITLLLSDYPIWSGLAIIALNSAILLGFLWKKDSGPPVYYVATLIMGVALLS